MPSSSKKDKNKANESDSSSGDDVDKAPSPEDENGVGDLVEAVKKSAISEYSGPLEDLLKGTTGLSSEQRKFMENIKKKITGEQSFMYFYLLIDPTKWPANLSTLTFLIFIQSIFYVGIGTVLRSFDHLIYAYHYNDFFKELLSYSFPKEKKIREIWSTNKPVRVIRIRLPTHAQFSEYASIKAIKAIGLKNLKNKEEGGGLGNNKEYVPSTKSKKLDPDEALQFGAYFLCDLFKRIARKDQLVDVRDCTEDDAKKRPAPSYPPNWANYIFKKIDSVSESDFRKYYDHFVRFTIWTYRDDLIKEWRSRADLIKYWKSNGDSIEERTESIIKANNEYYDQWHIEKSYCSEKKVFMEYEEIKSKIDSGDLRRSYLDAICAKSRNSHKGKSSSVRIIL